MGERGSFEVEVVGSKNFEAAEVAERGSFGAAAEVAEIGSFEAVENAGPVAVVAAADDDERPG